MSITDKLLKHANIKSNILFVGLGKTFQIWEPKTFEKFKLLARKKLIKIDQILNGKINRKGRWYEYKYWRRRIKGIKT